MRLKLAAVVACAVSMMAAAASADTKLGWYVAADVGVHDMREETLVLRDVTLVSGMRTPITHSTSSSVSAPESALLPVFPYTETTESTASALGAEAETTVFVRAGNQLTPHWRAELEYGDRPGDIRSGLISREGAETGRGSLNLTSLMFNIVYDALPDRRLHPFVGVGLGALKVNSDDTGSYQNPEIVWWTTLRRNYDESRTVRSRQTVAAGQVIAGLAWAVSQPLTIDLTYRYLETDKINYRVRTEVHYDVYINPNCHICSVGQNMQPQHVDEVHEGRMSGKVRDHSLTVGLRWSFGASGGPVT